MGTVLFRGKPVSIFEAYGGTLTIVTEGADKMAQEIAQRLKAKKTKKRRAKK